MVTIMSVSAETPQKLELSQKEYLKRYLSKDKGDRKKNKKAKISSSSHLKRSVIIDDDLGLPNVASIDDEEFNLDYLGDEAPQIAGVIDERPPEIKAKENYGDKNRWKPVGEPEESDVLLNSLVNVNEGSHVTANGNEKYAESNKEIYYDQYSSKNKSKSTAGKSSFIKERISRGSDSDLSPPRIKSKYGKKGNMSVKQRYSKDDDSDLSPPRSNSKAAEHKSVSRSHRKERNSSYSPHRRRDKVKKNAEKEMNISKGSDSDFSPPRKTKYEGKTMKYSKDDDSDLPSPRSKTKASEKEHFSRRDRARNDSNISLHRKGGFEGKYKRRGSDISPPRKKKYEGKLKRDWNDSDFSPPRKSKSDWRGKGKEGESDLSLRKNKEEWGARRKGSDSDLSPPRKNKHERPEKRHGKDLSPPRRSKKEAQENTKSMDKTLDGKKAGLQDAKNLKEELRKLKEAENSMYEKMKANVSGKTATTIVRDRKTGKIRDLNKEKEEELKKSVKVAERENKYAKWGKGLKQAEDAEERIADYLHEVNKPLARYAGDDDLERMLKSREREGDPMLEYIRNKQTESVDVDTRGKPTYQGYYLPNRFNIRPGHRWDGVDRSNGYEKQWFERQNARKALQEEAYKWSTSDM